MSSDAEAESAVPQGNPTSDVASPDEVGPEESPTLAAGLDEMGPEESPTLAAGLDEMGPGESPTLDAGRDEDAGANPARETSDNLTEPVQAASASTEPLTQEVSDAQVADTQVESEQATQEVADEEMAAAVPEAAEPPRKRRKKVDVSGFFDIEAQEADGSGEEEDASGMEDFLDASAEKKSASIMENAALAEEAMDAAQGTQSRYDKKIAELEEQYRAVQGEGKPAPASVASEGKWSTSSNKVGIITHITPEAKDPKLWCCKTFAPEKELCIALLLKAGACIAAGKPCPIYTAFYNNSLRGYIYVEAHKENDIRVFARGIRGISPWQIKLVPTAQMPQVFNSAMANAATQEYLKAGDWIRLKRGLYKGDLGQVIQLDDDDATVKLKPRLELGQAIGKGTMRGEHKNKKRPIAQWFNKSDVEQVHVVNTDTRMIGTEAQRFYEVQGEIYRDGFLVRLFKTSWLESGDEVRPQEHELQEWANAPAPSPETRPEMDGDDAKKMPPPSFLPVKKESSQVSVPLLEGDQIIVITGDIVGNRGTVIGVSPEAPTVLCRIVGVSEPLVLAIERLSKYFEIGDHVRVFAGDHDGDSGVITQVYRGPGDKWSLSATATILSDSLDKEFKVMCKQLRVSIENADPIDEVGEFKVGLIVSYKGKEVGMLTRIEARSRAIILLTDGVRHPVSLGEIAPMPIKKGKDNLKMWALDRAGRKLQVGAIVKAPRSLQKTAPLKAEVVYIYQKYLFLRALETLVGDKAFLVVQSDRCEFVYIDVKDDGKAKGDESKIFLPRDPLGVPIKEDDAITAVMSNSVIVNSSQVNWLSDKLKQKLKTNPNEATPEIFSKYASVRIFGGAYKGLRGEVREWLGQTVRISLLAKPKLVDVPIAYVGPDFLYDSPKGLRFPEATAVPPTPKLDDKLAASPLPDYGDENAPIAALASAETANIDEWDPNYGIEREPVNPMANTEVAFVDAVDDMEPVSNPTTSSEPVAARIRDRSPGASSQGSGRSAKRRRKPRLPGGAPVGDSPGSKKDSQGTPGTTPSPGHQIPKWAVPGVGVQCTHKGVTYDGVIGKVTRRQAINIYPFKTKFKKIKTTNEEILGVDHNEMKPLPCKVGDVAFIFDGKFVGQYGKVTEVDDDEVLVEVRDDEGELGELAAEPEHIALANKEWYEALNPTRFRLDGGSGASREQSEDERRSDAASEAATDDERMRDVTESVEETVGATTSLNRTSPVLPVESGPGGVPLTPGSAKGTPKKQQAPLTPQSAPGTPGSTHSSQRGAKVTKAEGGSTPQSSRVVKSEAPQKDDFSPADGEASPLGAAEEEDPQATVKKPEEEEGEDEFDRLFNQYAEDPEEEKKDDPKQE